MAVDSSESAVRLMAENFSLNDRGGDEGGHLGSGRLFPVCGDVTKTLLAVQEISTEWVDGYGETIQRPDMFDIVICDPPKLADSKASVKAAARK